MKNINLLPSQKRKNKKESVNYYIYISMFLFFLIIIHIYFYHQKKVYQTETSNNKNLVLHQKQVNQYFITHISEIEKNKKLINIIKNLPTILPASMTLSEISYQNDVVKIMGTYETKEEIEQLRQYFQQEINIEFDKKIKKTIISLLLNKNHD